MLDHLNGDLSCPSCDTPAMECENCGGVVHFELHEKNYNSFHLGMPFVEEVTECDGCGPDYII